MSSMLGFGRPGTRSTGMAQRMSRNVWRYAATAAALTVGGAMAGGASIGYYVAMSLTKPQRASKAQLVGIGSMIWRAGFNVLLFDYRGHGSDLGAPVTLGFREMNDFFAALDYTLGRMPDARIGVFGGSMGAAIAIMGSAQRS